MSAASIRPLPLLLLATLVLPILAAGPVHANVTAFEARVDAAIQRFYDQVPASQTLASRATGMLVLPRVYKGGLGVGIGAGDGALRVNGQTVQYYRKASASFGIQIGAQVRTEVVLFMTQEALDRFLASSNWQAGVDGSIAVIQFGVGKTIDTDNIRDPILGFVFGNKGLMFDLSFKGAKYSKIVKQ